MDVLRWLDELFQKGGWTKPLRWQDQVRLVA